MRDENYQIDNYHLIGAHDGVIRIWHWFNAVCILLLVVTGYLIGVPLPSFAGVPGEGYVMGSVRTVHMITSYLFCIAILLRIWWAVVGGEQARALFFLPVWSRKWMRSVVDRTAWLLLLRRSPPEYSGPHPIARIMHMFFFVFPTAIVILTGFAMYAEAAGRDSWQYMAFGWLGHFASNTQDWRNFHRLSMWVLSLYVFLHVYLVIHEEIFAEGGILGGIVGGKRWVRDRR